MKLIDCARDRGAGTRRAPWVRTRLIAQAVVTDIDKSGRIAKLSQHAGRLVKTESFAQACPYHVVLSTLKPEPQHWTIAVNATDSMMISVTYL